MAAPKKPTTSSAQKPAPKPAKKADKKPRPEIAYIMVHFKNHVPLVIDPSTTNCLVWGEKPGKEGYKVLEGFYLHKGETAKAAQVKRIWEGKKSRGGDESEPGVLVKADDCETQGEP